ncbi:MAG: c-type cytochrome [SAR324 cluster bacterium]|jgi:cytochrome c553|nr:cytochrome C [Deltaproteobacteria bacterium]MDP6093270.1 c-type cytochrome [SAR324 cluster bacterium]MBI14071.1 cytochrome C [Deltaproteobacteria bacterium]MBP43345.1 cytochrome C [Deltaproteobacteria bacterium]MDP6465309.1 c-type cytochrome [SAR324 cluster bacterium]|tara:strand:- start:1354 stop:2130 length:777 start_codon:yes stop_codon:yes gene_type:complete
MFFSSKHPIRLFIVFLSTALCIGSSLSLQAQEKSNLTSTAEFGGKWGTKVEEAIKALKLQGNIEDGQIIYEEICEACHQPGGNGDPAGNFPQLAGQQSTVVIKQIADIRAGNRDNPTMYPFANIEALRAATEDIFDEEKDGPQTLADVAAFIQTLPMSSSIKGPGNDLEHGEKVYAENCVRCHGDHGQGSFKNYYPVIAGQNYHYLMRQFRWIKEGKRRNANPEMVEQIARFTERDMLAVMDWVSRQKLQPGDWDPNN